MTGLFRAMTTNDVRTENGMPTNSTSSDNVLDLFYKMGGFRGRSAGEVLLSFRKAYSEDRLLATKALFYHRDVRSGQGERSSFRAMFEWLCNTHPDVARANLHNVPFYGRWDDVLAAFDTEVENDALELISKALLSGDALCAKWMPRANKAKARLARKIMNYMGLSPREYRKLLVANTRVVETQMCNNEWSAINFNSVPSNAISKLRKAFFRHDGERFSEWIKKLVSGNKSVKINASAIFPHDIVRKFLSFPTPSGAEATLLDEQWKALPNFVGEDNSFLAVCDVSGSMSGTPMEVSIALGIYLSERNVGPFKDGFITFSANPKLQILNGTLSQRISQLARSQWDMNTNLESVFELILRTAIKHRLANRDLPKNVIILSDMQFDRCVYGSSKSAMDMIRNMYSSAGYTVPNVIFWNLRTSTGVPAKSTESGVALVSGFSPSIMKTLLGGNTNPMKVMLATLNSDRYNRVV